MKAVLFFPRGGSLKREANLKRASLADKPKYD